MPKTCILVVDDSELLLMAVQDILTAAGYAVVTASDGKQALEVVRQASPRLIITDIQMPCMDGVALCHALRTSRQWATVPLIFMSAQDTWKNKHWREPAGAVDYLPKPFTPEDLLALVTHYV